MFNIAAAALAFNNELLFASTGPARSPVSTMERVWCRCFPFRSAFLFFRILISSISVKMSFLIYCCPSEVLMFRAAVWPGSFSSAVFLGSSISLFAVPLFPCGASIAC